MADLSLKSADDLFTMAMSGDKVQIESARQEMKRRSEALTTAQTLLAAAAASIEVMFTAKGGIYCQNPTWTALAESGNVYCPAVNFANVAQVRDICTSGTDINTALLRLCGMSDDDRTTAVEEKRVQKRAQLTAQRAALVVKIGKGKATADDLTEFDKKKPGYAPAIAA